MPSAFIWGGYWTLHLTSSKVTLIFRNILLNCLTEIIFIQATLPLFSPSPPPLPPGLNLMLTPDGEPPCQRGGCVTMVTSAGSRLVLPMPGALWWSQEYSKMQEHYLAILRKDRYRPKISGIKRKVKGFSLKLHNSMSHFWHICYAKVRQKYRIFRHDFIWIPLFFPHILFLLLTFLCYYLTG